MSNLSIEETDTLYLLINNKLPVPERLFRIGVRNDPYCVYCPGLEVSDIPHFFCTCFRVERVWLWLKSKLLQLVDIQQNSDWDIVNLAFPTSRKEKAFAWIIGAYVNYVWQTSMVKDELLVVDKFFGFLTYKYKEMRPSIGRIEWLE